MPQETDDVQELETEFARAKQIWNLAKICWRKKVSESRWNSEVHCQLLRAAFMPLGEEGLISYEDITTARVSDGSLLASVAGLGVSGKLVDYAITLADPLLKPRILKRLQEYLSITSYPTINCTSAPHVQFEPMVIYVETKKAAGDTSNQELQIGKFCTAHFLKLRQLALPQTPALPVLPALMVDGHNWLLTFAQWWEDSRGTRVISYSPIFIASTDNIAGIYRIIRILQQLGKWMQTSYRPWFETNALRLATA